MFNHLSIAEQDESINHFYRNVVTPKQIKLSRADNKTEPHGRAMSKVMTMFNEHSCWVELVSVKDMAYGLLYSITEFCDYERGAISTDHRMNSSMIWGGANIKQ